MTAMAPPPLLRFRWPALGYDSDLDEHVLVSLVYEEKNPETRDYKLRCEQRWLSDHMWYLADPPPRPVADVPPAYVDGKIYWLVDPDLGPISSEACEMMALDTTDKDAVFEVLQGPPCSLGRVSILELHGRIGMAWSDRDADAIDVWTMKDGGEWCVEHRIELAKFSPEYSAEETTLLGIDPTNGRILLNTGRSLGYYDPKKVELETIYSVGDSEPGYKFCPVICQESLVLPFME